MKADKTLIIIASYAIVFMLVAILWLKQLFPFQRGTGLNRVQFLYQDFPSVSELILWAQEFSVSLDQLKGIYEWRIKQWSNFGNAVLTAALAFASTVIIGVLKREVNLSETRDFSVVCAGIIISLVVLVYLFCQNIITRLRREFTSLLNILSMLK